MEEIKLESYVNEKCVVQQIRAIGIYTCINRCRDTATELSPENRSRIESIRQIYIEISEAELQDWQLARFISQLLETMTEDLRHTFLAIEFVECRRK